MTKQLQKKVKKAIDLASNHSISDVFHTGIINKDYSLTVEKKNGRYTERIEIGNNWVEMLIHYMPKEYLKEICYDSKVPNVDIGCVIRFFSEQFGIPAHLNHTGQVAVALHYYLTYCVGGKQLEFDF